LDFSIPVAYRPELKNLFHREVQKLLKALAAELGFPEGSYDLRSTKTAPAVSGDIVLHHASVYVLVRQSSTGESDIIIRPCNGRNDLVGGINNFAPIDELHNIPALAARIRSILADHA